MRNLHFDRFHVKTRTVSSRSWRHPVSQSYADLVYVGGTANYNSRKHQHKSRVQNPNDREYMASKYVEIRANGRWDSFRMVPIKEICVDSNCALEIEEEKCRLELKATLNKNKAYATATSVVLTEEQKEKMCEARAEKFAKYREQNYDAIQSYRNTKPFLRIKTRQYPVDAYKEWVLPSKKILPSSSRVSSAKLIFISCSFVHHSLFPYQINISDANKCRSRLVNRPFSLPFIRLDLVIIYAVCVISLWFFLPMQIVKNHFLTIFFSGFCLHATTP